MAPIYDVRDPEPSSVDDSFEVLDDLGILFHENTASPGDSRASGSGDPTCDDGVPKGNETENSESKNGSELPSDDESSIEVIDVPNDEVDANVASIPPSDDEPLEKRENSGTDDDSELTPIIDSIDVPSNQSVKNADSIPPFGDDETPVEPLENRAASTVDPKKEYDHESHSMDQKVFVNPHEKGDGDKLEALANFGMDLAKFHLFEQFIAFSTATTIKKDERNHNAVANCVGEERMIEVPCVGSSGENGPNSHPDSSMGGVKQNLMTHSMLLQNEAIPTAEHQAKIKANKITLESNGNFSDKNGKQYIKIEGPPSVKMMHLGFSAQLTYDHLNLAIHNQGCLMVTDDNFVAKVRLDQPRLLNGTRNFQHAAEVLLNNIRIDRVLLDEVTADRDECRELFLVKLEDTMKRLAKDEEQVTVQIELLELVERYKQRSSLTYTDLCREIKSNQFQCTALQEHARKLETVEQKASRREKLFKRFEHYPRDNSPNLLLRLDELAKQIVKLHMDILLTKAPAYLHKPLRTIGPQHLMLISSSDVKLFTDMSSVLRADIFEKPFLDLANRWINRIKAIKVDRLKKAPQLTSAIYFSLCKSLEEVIVGITEYADHQASDLLVSSNLGWFPIKSIVWRTESAVTKCLQREYEFIFRLLKHFELASDFGRQSFQYEIQLFNNSQSTSLKVLSGIKKAFVRSGQFFGYGRTKSNPFDVPDDFYVWYCLLDDVLFHVLPTGCELDMFEHLFEGYVQMIRDAKYDQMETLRVVTHNLVRFIAQSFSYGRRTPLSAPLDNAVLRKQLDIFSFRTNQSIISSNNFRDQVDVFNIFWKIRSDIIDQFPTKINLPEMNLMQERLMEIMLIVLGKNVKVETMVAFSRTYNDFLIDLNEVSFDWYIKDIPDVDMSSIMNLRKVELVDNKWKDTINRTYKVLEPENFPVLCKLFGKQVNVPKHYVIEVIQALLEHIGSQLQQTSWAADTDGTDLSDTDQVLSTNELICAIRNSLLYLKEQVDYVSFDLFYDERVKPFSSVLKTATSRQDFSNRIYLIKESFWYIRKQNELSFDEALKLYDEFNTSHDSQLLRESYAKYSQFFGEFMQLSVYEEYYERASHIVEKVKAQLSKPIQFKAWDDRFKQDQVPQILAGVAAVWSILVSKDVSKAGKYFNPHCIQIMCVLRLLSVDNAEQGIDKHLAQVLTGQGKSLILGLLAALFALTGHRVRIACYSKYLAERDQQELRTFYKMFDIVGDVKYGTFADLANEIVAPKVGSKTFKLRDLVKDLLFKEKAILPHQLVTADSSKDVLLMDEVDVFFTEEFYGSTHNPACTPVIPGLDRIQEEIWKCVVDGCMDVESRIRQYILSCEFEQREDFLKFLKRSNNYTLLNDKSYTNETLFDENVRLMVRDAANVNSGWSSEKFKLNSGGVITYNDRGTYVFDFKDWYKNVFNYFRLKKENFVTHVNGIPNYGYLIIHCGSLSYALLPKNYPLIVGVSGTLTSLNQHEKDTIERLYNIKQTSVMPTFFGCTNLQFDEVKNVHHHATKSSWRTNIFSQANQMTATNRAVIVFFDTDVELNAFEAEYAGQLDRVNVLTENTEDKERFISEAGVAKTITLATRGMGRGVDYKSSVTVEKNGGVHIIQTFFSMDIKEEIQIKGRTARKDNKGSYELIVCDEDLRLGRLMTYAELDAERSKTSLNKKAELSKKIQSGMDAHQKTMDYMGSFYKPT